MNLEKWIGINMRNRFENKNIKWFIYTCIDDSMGWGQVLIFIEKKRDQYKFKFSNYYRIFAIKIRLVSFFLVSNYRIGIHYKFKLWHNIIPYIFIASLSWNYYFFSSTYFSLIIIWQNFFRTQQYILNYQTHILLGALYL